jgi:hypothetical protein
MHLSMSAAVRASALALLAVTAAACSSYRISEPRAEVLHPFAPISADFARVCVIRTSRLALTEAFPTLDNDKLVGATKGPTFFCYKAEPGEHTIEIKASKPTVVQLHAEAGRSYYLHETLPYAVLLVLTCTATWVSEAAARDLVNESTYEVITEAPEHVPDPIPYANANTR